MLDDSMDDLFGLEEEIPDKKSIKFQPKGRAKPVNLASQACPKTSDGGHTVPPKSYSLYADLESQEDIPSNTDDVDHFYPEQGCTGKGADMSSNFISTGDLMGPSSATEAASASTFHSNDPSTTRESASELDHNVECVDHNDPLLEAGKQVHVDNNQVNTVFSNMESLDCHAHHPSASVVKFQPKATALTKEQKPKSVHFLLPEEIGSSSLGYFSEAVDNGINQMTSADNLEELFRLSSPTSNPDVDLRDTSEYSGISPFDSDVSHSKSTEGDIFIFPVTSEEQEDLAEAAKTTSRTNVVDYEAQYHTGHELEQLVEERPIQEILEVVKAGEPYRNLRKRPAENEVATSDDSEILKMDHTQNDMEYHEEDMSKKKRYKKSKKQISETEKSKRRCKKVSNESDTTEKEQLKKKFPHSTRRRKVDKALLQTPEDEINVRQIALKDLIMLAEAKEKMSSKTAAALGKSFSNKSHASMYSDNEVDLFGEDEERNHYDYEASERVQAPQKKLNYHSYMNKPATVRWSKSEIDLLYQAIRQFGTDFTMIQQLFPNRTRHQVKLKFKNEERKHPLQIQDALFNRCKDNSHFKQVIEQLNIKPKEVKIHDAGDDHETNFQDPEDEIFKDGEDPHKDEDVKGREDQGPELNAAKDEPNKPEDLNGLENMFDWDVGDNESMDEFKSWDYES